MFIFTTHQIFIMLILSTVLQSSSQNCPEEYSHNGISVKWSQSPTAFNIESDPLCYTQDHLVKRNCTDDKWTPTIEDVGPCVRVDTNFNATSCPPGFNKISENNYDYCVYIGPPAAWDYPCFSSGGAFIITDLDEDEINSLIDSLIANNRSRYFWLPAQRAKRFNPVVWSVPGPNWGVLVETNEHLTYQNLIWKNCLALDVELRILTTDTCTQKYPSLCFYINDVNYPAVCPKGYRAFRYKPDNGTCYGIETSDSDTGLTFESFVQTKCQKPMSFNSFSNNRFIFTKLAELNELPNDKWCWFKKSTFDFENVNLQDSGNFEGIINNVGTVGLINSTSHLPCMACQTDVVYGETELMFEYNEVDNQIYLTIYFPSGLWKYDYNDKGIRCFSDAKGFVKVVDINDLPFLSVKEFDEEGSSYIEKVVYNIDLVTQRSAQYWCEGHTFNLSLISTNKLVVNPKGKEIHVFALTVRHNFNFTNEIEDISGIDNMISDLTIAVGAEKIILMDVFDLTFDYIIVLLHVHIAVVKIYEIDALNIQSTYDNLKENAEQHLQTVNCSLVSLASCVYCLPTTSSDFITLNWNMTPIGHISAPSQFCLQSNGLPVKRQCLGSYHTGASWGDVEGRCNSNYLPTVTTAFLYNVVKGQLPFNYTSRFLTHGLEFVLSDVDIIIPADIYYLSMSLQQVLQVAQGNDTCIDIGDIDNIAWVMDRVMELDFDYLRLAQTLNSTNVILNSVNDIIEMIAKQSSNNTNTTSSDHYFPVEEAYQISVKPMFVVQISYPMLTNVTGVAVLKVSDSEKFTNMTVIPLYSNTTLDDVLAIENLEIATWLPLKLINTLKPNSNESTDTPLQSKKFHIIISLYQNDAVFQELTSNNHVINSRIAGVSIPGYMSNLKHPLPIVFRQLNHVKHNTSCGFWDFRMEKDTQMSGFWKTQGCFPVKSMKNITVCECYHLTHFSQLITIPSSNSNNSPNLYAKPHIRALNIITLIGCFLSLLGIVGIWITALVFSNWRKKAGTKVLLQLSTAIALPLMFIVIFNLDNNIFVHENNTYVLAEFIRYVRVLGVSRPSRFMFKFSMVGWGIPLVPVIIVLSLDVENYIPDSSQCKRLCYPKGYYFILSVMLPICIILFVNIVLFCLVLHSISRGSNDKMKSTDIDLVGAQLRLSVFLFFLLGLTWIFGIFSFTANLLWSYLFCLTSTLQGFVLFIYFIICDPTTRNMWITLVKPPFSSNNSRNSITSLS